MLKTLRFALRVIVLSALVLWVVNNPGIVKMDWLGYSVQMHTALFCFALFVLVVVCLVLQRCYLFLRTIPQRMRIRALQRDRDYGAQAIMLSLSAQAAGDIKRSNSYIQDLHRYYGDNHALSLFFEAQTALLAADYKTATPLFASLLEHKDAAFLGLRGLMVIAIEQSQLDKALHYAEKARKIYPKQPWVIQILYHLQIKNKKWDEALATLEKTRRISWIMEENRISDIQALYILRAGLQNTDDALRGRYLRQAHKLNVANVPATVRLAQYYLNKKKIRKAKTVIEKCWKLNPHPELASLWGQLAPAKKSTDSLQLVRWMDKLVTMQRDNAYGFVALGEAAIQDSLWGEARVALEKALSISEDSKTYELLAQLSEAQGYRDEAKEHLRKAAKAGAGQVWTCRETGLIYESWSPLAKPHNSFNTIVWGYPNRGTAHASTLSVMPALKHADGILTNPRQVA